MKFTLRTLNQDLIDEFLEFERTYQHKENTYEVIREGYNDYGMITSETTTNWTEKYPVWNTKDVEGYLMNVYATMYL